MLCTQIARRRNARTARAFGTLACVLRCGAAIEDCTPEQFFPGTWQRSARRSLHGAAIQGPPSIDFPCCGWELDTDFWRRDPRCKFESPNVVWEDGIDYRQYAGDPGHYARFAGHGCFCEHWEGGRRLVAAEWHPHSCTLRPWDPNAFCELLGARSILLIGDSTMDQSAATLMNALHAAECLSQVVFAPADTLVHRTFKQSNRGRHWTEWVDKLRPAYVVVTAGAHLATAADLREVLEALVDEYDARYRSRGVQLIWKTQNPAGCGAQAPTTEPLDLSGDVTAVKYGWTDYFQWDRVAIEYMASRSVPVLDVRALYLRSDAHPGSNRVSLEAVLADSERNGATDCFHFCTAAEGPLRVVPQLLHHLLWWLERSAAAGSVAASGRLEEGKATGGDL